MEALIVHCHPEPHSFNGSLTKVAEQTLSRLGYAVQISDLYREDFDPLEKPEHYSSRIDPVRFSPLAEQRHAAKSSALPPPVAREIARLERADLVLLQFPLWWHGPPAMMKGWFDRVFINGRIYTSTMRYDRGYFRGKRAICSVTTGAPATAFGSGGRGGDIERLLWPVHYSLRYVGFDVLPPFLAFGIQGHGYVYQGNDEFRCRLRQYGDDWANQLAALDAVKPLPFPGWDDWDADGGPKPRGDSFRTDPIAGE